MLQNDIFNKSTYFIFTNFKSLKAKLVCALTPNAIFNAT